MNADSEQMRVVYEGAVKLNPSDIEAVQYLAVWHLERHSFQQARKYFGHLATLKQFDADVWLCLSVCCAMAEEFSECSTALKTAQNLIPQNAEDIRVKFCNALMSEKRKDYTIAMEGYVTCLNQCAAAQNQPTDDAANSNSNNGAGTAASNEQGGNWPAGESSGATSSGQSNAGAGTGTGTGTQKLVFMKELRGEVMLRIAVLKKEMGAIDQSMQMCNSITTEAFGDSIRANALCLKGLLHEMRAEFPASEVVYRSVLQITSGHSTALERLGRVYLRYRETIPAAVQCFFKSVETNPSNHVAWYLLGRCYMATSQYSDACEAYNRAVNLNPNDPQVWCSLGVLYYAFGQYREALGMLARALKLDSTMADAWYNVGALYDMCDQPEDAQQAYMKAKENGLADRFARAGMGLNPLAMQSLQFINSTSASNSAAAAVKAATTIAAPPAASSSSSDINTAVAPNAAPVESAPSSAPVTSAAPAHSAQAAASSNTNKTATAARKQQLQQQQLLHQQQALQQHQLQQQQQQMQMKQLQIQQQQMYQQQQAQQHRAMQYQQQQQQALQQQLLQQQQMNLPPEQAAQFQQHLQQLQYQQQMHQLQSQQQQIHYQQQQLQQHGASIDHSQQAGQGQGQGQGQHVSQQQGPNSAHAQHSQHPHGQSYYDMQHHGATAEQLQALQQLQQQQQHQQSLQGRAQDPPTPQHNNGHYGTSLMDNPTGF